MSGAPGHRSASSPTRAWRGTARDVNFTGRARHIKRALLSLLFVALVGALGAILFWWLSLSRVHLVVLPVVDYDPLVVPPIPLPSTEQLEEELSGLSLGEPALLLPDLQTFQNMDTLGSRLGGAVRRPRDTLIVYVSAHGVSEGGTAYLLCSDYMRSGEAARRRLGEVLRHLQQCPAARKLLVLDVGHLAADPRLGMVVNEFPRLLEEEVKAVDDPNLWVLTANASMELSRVSHSLNRSIFGYLVVEGLRGAADTGSDGTVHLDELFSFVHHGVADWVKRDSGGQQTQTPRLLQGGVGFVDLPPDLKLTPVSDQGSPEKPSTEVTPGDDELAGGTSEDNEVGGSSEKPGSGNLPASTEVTPGDDEPAGGTSEDNEVGGSSEKPGSGNLPARKARDRLAEAWQLCQQMQDRSEGDSWSPVDYAPHLWRELLELVLGYELRYRCGRTFDANVLAEALEDVVEPLKSLVRGEVPRAGTRGSTVVDRLADARQRFLEGQARRSFEQESKEIRAIRAAIQLKNDLVFRAPYYVRFHAHVSRSSITEHPLRDSIAELLTRLQKAIDVLESLEEASYAGAMPDQVQTMLLELDEGQQILARLRDEIERDGWEKDARELIAAPGQPGSANLTDALLSVPCLTCVQRLDVLDSIGRLRQPRPKTVVEDPIASLKVPAIARWRWDRLAEQAELEVRLVALSDPAFASRLECPAESSHPAIPAAEESLWLAYRALGSELGAFYRGLPARVNDRASSADLASLRSVEHLLRAIDARDARKVTAGVESVAIRVIRAPVRAVVVDGPKETLTLESDNPTPIEVSVRVVGFSPDTAEVMLRYDPQLVGVTHAEARPVPAPGAWTKLPTQEYETSLRYQAVAKADTGADTTFEVTVRAGGKSADLQSGSHTIQLRLPAPDRIQLVVAGDSGTVDRQTDRSGSIRLRPFPNRVTQFRFDLVNHSSRPRKVTVQLARLAENAPAARRHEIRLLLDGSGNLRPGVESLVPPVELELPADAIAVPIPFSPPADPSAEKPKEVQAANTKGQPPAGTAEPLVSRGLACIVRDAADRDRRWITWLDFAPLAPKDYVAPDVSYDPVQRRITIHVKALDADGDGQPEVFPQLGPDQPTVEVTWGWAGELDAGTEMKDRCQIAEPGGVGKLFAEVEPSVGTVKWVRLTVDDYPRAFQYQVRCDRQRRQVDRERSLSHLEITSPPPDHCYRVPLEDSMLVRFRVDAPEDAFQNPGDVIELGIDENGDRILHPQLEKQHQLLADRQVEVRLNELGTDGTARFHTKVGDFAIELDPAGLKNKRVDIMARLLLVNRNPTLEPVTAEDSVGVFLDGAPPRFQIETPVRAVPQGSHANITVDVTEELTGIDQMEFGFDLDRNGTLEEDEKPKIVQQPGLDGKWSAALPTKELQPGQYFLLVQATDKVGHDRKQRQSITIGPPEDKADTGLSTIIGRVVLQDGRPLRRIQVSLEGSDKRAVTDANGRFTFRDVPHGKKKLIAKGFAIGRELSGSKEIKLPADKEPAEVEIRLEW